MARWDAKNSKIVSFPSYPVENYPDWVWDDCGCCAGLIWGGDSPRECPHCNGGQIARHVPSGVLALWPGGPFVGRLTLKEQKDEQI